MPSSRRCYDACKIGLILEKNVIHYTNGLKGKHHMLVSMKAEEIHFKFTSYFRKAGEVSELIKDYITKSYS